MHWQSGHYGAVLSRRDGWYQVADATFDCPRWMDAPTVEAEASGYILAPAAKVPAGWPILPPGVADKVLGNTQPASSIADPRDQLLGRGGCPSHMMSWQVTEPYLNLWLSDSPLNYQPALGPRVAVEIVYKQRDQFQRNARIFDIGAPGGTNSNWALNWQTYFEVLDQGGAYASFNATLHAGDGGLRTYYFSNDGNDTNDRLYDSSSATRLERLPNATSTLTGFRLTYPDGRQDYFTNLVDFATSNKWAFRTSEQDPQGHANLYRYTMAGDVVRLTSVVDADGHTNSINYYDASTSLIKEIVDPFNRTNRFRQNASGCLTNITDIGGLSVSVAYGASGWVTNLTTPYGPTTFTYFGGCDGSAPADNSVNRAIIVTEPNAGQQMFLFRGLASQLNTNAGSGALIPDAYPAGQIPATNPLGTLDTNGMNYRVSFHWDQRQYQNLSASFRSSLNFTSLSLNDYNLARLSHWLYCSTNSTVGETLSMVREPSPDGSTEGPKTWFDYAGKSSTYYEGTNTTPSVVARVLADASTAYSYRQFNAWQLPTSALSTYTTAGGIATRTTTTTYAANNLDPVQVTGPDSTILAGYAVDTNAHLVTAVTNSIGVTRYTYDAALRLTSTVQPAGAFTTNYYYSTAADANRLQSSVVYDAVGGTPLATNSYTYYANGLVYSHTDERNLTTVNTWDNFGHLLTTTWPDGTYISNVYTWLDLAASRDRLGNWTYYGYDALRRQTAVTNALNQVTLTTYCGCGSPETITTAAGVTTMFYDNAGRLTARLDPATNLVTYTYNAAGQLYSTIDALGHSVTNAYNNQGLVSASSNASGLIQQTLYDIYDRPSSVTDANGVSTTNTYDATGRVLTRTYPTGGGFEQFGYSTNISAATSYTNQVGYVTRFAFDSLGRKTNTVAGSGTADAVTNSFVFNGAGDLLTLRDGKNNTVSWAYDGYGRVISKRDANTTEILRYQYDAGGRLTNRWSAAKGTTAYVYDPLGNLLNTIYPSLTLQFSYDSVNRLTNMVDALGATTYTYDGNGAVRTEDGPWASDTMTFAYTNGLRIGLSLQQPAASDWSQTYGYDGANRLQTLVSPAGTFTYQYASAGNNLAPASRRPVEVDFSYGSIVNAYDNLARLTNTALRNASYSVLNAHAYAYNYAGQRTRMTSTSAANYVDYGYDALGQLTSASGRELANGALRQQEQFGNTYDKAGNLSQRLKNQLTETFGVDANNQLTSVSSGGTLTVAGTTTPTATQVTVNGLAAAVYADKSFALTNVSLATTSITAVATDGQGNASSHTITVNVAPATSPQYDQNGNMTSDGRRIFTYDTENQLVTVVATNNAINSTQTGFVYDGKMRRRIRTEAVWQASGWVTNQIVRYLYDGYRVIQERDGNNTVLVSYTRGLDLSQTLEGAGGIGGLLARTHPGSHHFYYHADGNGNVTAIMNQSQTLVAQYRYDPFGSLISQSGTLADANLYRFSSKEFHQASGLYYYGYRFYEPNLQRWLNRDPIHEYGFLVGRQINTESEMQQINAYAFVGNDSLNTYDLFGLLQLRDCNREKGQCIVNGGLTCGIACAVVGEGPWCLIPCAVVYAGICTANYQECLLDNGRKRASPGGGSGAR